MSFDPGGGGIANANDVALNNPADAEVLAYNGGIGKWTNDPLGSGSTVLDLVAGSTSLSNSTTPITISGFAITDFSVGDIWHISGEVIYDAAQAADIKFRLIVPSGSTVYGRMTGIDLTSTSTDSTHTSVPMTAPTPNNLTASFGAIGVGNLAVATINVRVVIAASGTFALRFAQNTADNSAVTVAGGSWLLAARAASS